MHLDQKAIRAGGDSDPRQRRNQFAMPGRVAGIGDHRQVRNLLEQRDSSGIEGIAHRGFKGADAALAQNDVGVAVAPESLAPSAARSAIVAIMPRFSRIGRPDRAAASSSV